MSPHVLFRPPGEADSLIIRVADGCPWNRCSFCGMYASVRYRACSARDIEEAIGSAAADEPNANRIFLADGDVMALPADQLGSILKELNGRFPKLARVGVYANGSSIATKTDDELRSFAASKLQTLYMGLESGDDLVLAAMNKRETAGEMVDAAIRAQACGLRMSVMILIGLGGREGSAPHAAATAAALNTMQPRLLSALRVTAVPGTALWQSLQRGTFTELTEHEAVAELRAFIAALDLDRTVFRANHASNVVPLEGRFPKDKPRLLAELDQLLESAELEGVGGTSQPNVVTLWASRLMRAARL